MMIGHGTNEKVSERATQSQNAITPLGKLLLMSTTQVSLPIGGISASALKLRQKRARPLPNFIHRILCKRVEQFNLVT